MIADPGADAAALGDGRHLLGAVERACRAPQGRFALVLRLSRMAPPGLRAHHRRIARATVDDAAQRGSGQVFALGNGDLLLLYRPEDETGAPVADLLAGLFAADVSDPAGLLTLWSLARDGAAVRDYARARLEDALPGPPCTEPAGSADAIDDAVSAVGHDGIGDLLRRQTAVLLSPESQSRVLPLFREVTFSVPALEARTAALRHANADPFLFHHLASRLDGRMLDALRQDLQANGPLAAGAREAGPALHLNLTLSGIMSDRFAHFAAACRAVGARIGIEVSLVEACADPEAFAAARTRLRLAGLAFVLDSVSHHALMLTMPMALRPDLVKLDWSPRLPEAGGAMRDAVAALGSGRVVLQRAETEDALRWGLAHGIRRFQGRHVDAMLAAGRIGACTRSRGCSLAQCAERAGAVGSGGGRAGCNNPALLDAAVLSDCLDAPA